MRLELLFLFTHQQNESSGNARSRSIVLSYILGRQWMLLDYSLQLITLLHVSHDVSKVGSDMIAN